MISRPLYFSWTVGGPDIISYTLQVTGRLHLNILDILDILDRLPTSIALLATRFHIP